MKKAHINLKEEVIFPKNLFLLFTNIYIFATIKERYTPLSSS